jgi:hypothetical protein
MGADAATELSHLLNEEKINVELLITIDLVSYDRTTEINENVKVAKNYYQRNLNFLTRGSLLTLADNNSATQLSNTEANYYSDFYNSAISNDSEHAPTFWHTDFWHITIDDALAPYIIANSKNIF